MISRTVLPGMNENSNGARAISPGPASRQGPAAARAAMARKRRRGAPESGQRPIRRCKSCRHSARRNQAKWRPPCCPVEDAWTSGECRPAPCRSSLPRAIPDHARAHGTCISFAGRETESDRAFRVHRHHADFGGGTANVLSASHERSGGAGADEQNVQLRESVQNFRCGPSLVGCLIGRVGVLVAPYKCWVRRHQALDQAYAGVKKPAVLVALLDDDDLASLLLDQPLVLRRDVRVAD